MPVDVELADNGVAKVTLNRPEKMNAIDGDMRAGLHRAWDRITSDDAVRVAVVIGAGEKAFCAGADLKNSMPPAESFAALAFGTAAPHHLLHGLETDKPIVCAINGYAIGGGLELALGSDIRICAEHAEFGLAEVRHGTIPGGGGTQRLPRAIGQAAAMYMLLTGDRIDAATALRFGLVSEVVESSAVESRALAIAERIAANGPLAVRAAKRLATVGSGMPLDAALEFEEFVWGNLRDTEDRLEGRRAFSEGRQPNFVGS